MPVQARFDGLERALLLRQSRIGPGVIEALEQIGISSLDQLRAVGVETVVDRICASAGNPAWRNRLRALRQAVAVVPTFASGNASCPKSAPYPLSRHSL